MCWWKHRDASEELGLPEVITTALYRRMVGVKDMRKQNLSVQDFRLLCEEVFLWSGTDTTI